MKNLDGVLRKQQRQIEKGLQERSFRHNHHP
jgi:hypothetical protein